MTQSDKKLFLLDAYALIYRGFFAFAKNPRINSKGLDTSAILGFTNTLVDILKKENPSHIAVVFDTSKPTFRHVEYPEYKAHRDAMPEGIQVAIPYIYELLKYFKIPQLSVDGWEADDVIGTLAKKAEKAGFTTYMMTPDKDYAQLVSENIFMYKPARMGNGIEILGIEQVKEKFEIDRVDQVIDYLGMMGDASDNIPGLPGVGDKTAKKFIKAYGSMEGLFENIGDLKGKMKEKVEANQELGLLSKKLVTIDVDAPIEFDEKDLIREQADTDELIKLFTDLEFRRLTQTVANMFGVSSANSDSKSSPTSSFGSTTSSSTPLAPASGIQGDLFSTGDVETSNIDGFQNIENTKHHYELVDNPIARKLLLRSLLQQESVCFDTETTSLNTFEAQLVGIAFSWEAHKGYYLTFNDDNYQEVLDQFREFFENDKIEKIGQNLKYDLKVLGNRYNNIRVKGPFFDTMLAHYLINPDMRHNMDVLSQTYLNYSPVSIETLIGSKGKNQKSMKNVPLDQQCEYAVEDADITFQLKQLFELKLKENNAWDVYANMEIPLLEVLTDMELTGIKIDTDALKSQSEQLKIDIASKTAEIYEQAGEEFNISSPKQIGDILFGKLELMAKPKKTKTGQFQTSENILSKLAPKHKIVADILEYRSLVKLKSTYVDALPTQIEKSTGKIHTTYSQTTAATGRLSSNNPNLQNIPIRTERGQAVRAAFIASSDEKVLLAADYSQIELRLIAELSKDTEMVNSFKNNEDIHASTASKVFGVPLEEVTREQRSHAKTVNFGIIYGVSAFGLSEQTSLSRKESAVLIDQYYSTYTMLKDYMDKQVEFARERGYVETIFGRRRYLSDINSRNAMLRTAAERNAVNAPIQGSAADIVKIAMINVYKRFQEENIKSKMILQVHDELVFDAYKDELDKIKSIVKQEMEAAINTEVPMLVDMGIGNNWLEAH
jgi:DNA polymerase-1